MPLYSHLEFSGQWVHLVFLYKVRSPTQLPSGSLKPAPPIYTTILRKNGTSLIFRRCA
nr:MAG TPA_asm: hypothetical protein [Caudoviricetes sp.]